MQRTLFLAAIKKLLTHSIWPIIVAGGLILIYDFFALKTERVVWRRVFLAMKHGFRSLDTLKLVANVVGEL